MMQRDVGNKGAHSRLSFSFFVFFFWGFSYSFVRGRTVGARRP